MNSNLNFEVIDCRSTKEKLRDFGYDVRNTVKKGVHWVAEHPMETVSIVAGVVTATAEVRRCGDRITAAHEDRINKTRMYCNDVQSYVQLKHEPKAKELMMLRSLMNEGYTKFEALTMMDLLK